MEISEIKAKIRAVSDAYGIEAPSFSTKVFHAGTLGEYDYKENQINLDNFIVNRADSESVEGLLSHELTHAVEYKTEDRLTHDKNFKSRAKELEDEFGFDVCMGDDVSFNKEFYSKYLINLRKNSIVQFMDHVLRVHGPLPWGKLNSLLFGYLLLWSVLFLTMKIITYLT